MYQRASEKGERERTGYVRPKIHRDTALRKQKTRIGTDTERRERINVYNNKMTNNKQQPTMGRGSVTAEQAGEQMPMPVRCPLVSNLCPIAGCCALVRYLLTYIYIYFRLLRLPVSASIRVLCVEGLCPCVSSVLRNRSSLFLHPRLFFGSRPPRSRLVSIRTCVISRHREIRWNAIAV